MILLSNTGITGIKPEDNKFSFQYAEFEGLLTLSLVGHFRVGVCAQETRAMDESLGGVCMYMTKQQLPREK